ncbi:MAG TPA: DNA-processing protein DprA [Chthoniobacterales bacterium]
MTHTEACIALNMIAKIGPVRIRRLREVFGSPERILAAKRHELQSIDGIGPETAVEISDWENRIDLSAELARVRDFGATVLTQEDAVYPKLLREIHDPPTVLYVWGRLSEKDHHAIGVVGSRKTTHYGLESARKLSYQIAYAGLTVVSGLARGIDTAAHLGALAAKGRTVAVVGGGFHYLYPPENRELAEKISANGAVVSEFSMTVQPDRQTFPMRNRIISGWSFGTLVVEAGLNSGALISANMAIDQGRTVYAVPGPIDRPNSLGSNRLIQQGAKLVMDASDILDDMGTLFREEPRLERSAPAGLSDDQQAVYDAISGDETPADAIIATCGLAPARVMSTLLALEMKHFVKQLPGQRFVKLL